MYSDIFEAKVRIPPLQRDLIRRSYLVSRLEQGLSRRLTLLCSPPGFGKTTLLQEWATQTTQAVAWLSLDHADNDAILFWRSMSAAIHIGSTELAHPIRQASFSLRSAQIALLNELNHSRCKICLILDDYEAIHNRDIHATVSYMLENLPGGNHIIIASHTVPPLPLARLRAHGQISEFYMNDLAFSYEEVSVFFRDLETHGLSQKTISELHAYTEGWIDGLQLAKQVLSNRKQIREADDIVNSFYKQPCVVDYFEEEILQNVAPELQEFMLQLSVLDDFNSALSTAITGDPNAHLYLKQIVRDNLFVLESSRRQAWFRFHQLFATFLRHRLREIDADLIPVLHQRASIWYQRNGYASEAVKHALSGKDWERARRLMAINAETLALQNRLDDTSRWIEERLSKFPLKSAEAEQITDQLIAEQVSSLAADDERLTYATDVLSLANIHMALGEMEKAELLLSSNDLTHLTTYDRQYQLSLITALGETYLARGKLHLAAATYGPFLDQAAARVDYRFYGGAARLHYEWNQLSQAQNMLQQLFAHEDETPSLTIDKLKCLLLSAAIHLAMNELAMYAKIMERTILLVKQYKKPEYDALLATTEVQAGLKRGDMYRTQLSIARQYELDESLAYAHQFEYLTLAWALVADKRVERAFLILDRLSEAAEVNGRTADLIEIGTLKALAYQAAGNQNQAFAELGATLCLAEPQRYIRTFVDKGAPMVKLLRLAHRRGVTLFYTRELLAAFPMELIVNSRTKIIRQPTGLANPPVEPLTAREIQVLKLAAAGHSNREIAELLTIAYSTVKKHMSNVMGKLSARNRTEAAAKARARNIV